MTRPAATTLPAAAAAAAAAPSAAAPAAAGTGRTRRRSAAVAVVAATLVASTLGCGVPEEGLVTIDRSEMPASLREESTTTTAPEGPDVAVAAVHWIRGQELVQESVLFESGPDVGRLLALLERGPSEDGAGATTRSAISGTDAIVDAVQRDDTVVVELAEVTGPDQVLAIAQVVMTLTSLPGVDSVRFVRDDETVEVPLPDGQLVRRPLTAADYSSLLMTP